MPASTSAVQFLDVPAGLTGNALIQAVNDRLRRITQALNAASPQPKITGVLNMENYRIVVLGDAVNPQDALNMETGDKRYATPSQVKQVVSETTVNNTTTTTGGGSSAAGPLLLSVPGTLAIESSAAALVSFAAVQKWTTVTLLLKEAPAGAAVTIALNANGTQLGTATVAAGVASSTATISWSLPANQVLSVDVTGVGLTFPGADLTVELS